MKALKRDIEKQKKRLIAKVNKNGLYENFGQKEVMKLEDKHIDSYAHENGANEKIKAILDFENWCMDYCG